MPLLSDAPLTAEQRTMAVRLRSAAMKQVEDMVTRMKLDHATRRQIERVVETRVNEIVEGAAVAILEFLDGAVDRPAE